MFTGTLGAERIGASVIAVPPLARTHDLELDPVQNRLLLRHLADGGIHTVLYGGNANLSNVSRRDYERLVTELPAWAGESTWLIPSFGPSYGAMLDGVEVLRGLDYPTAMALPLDAPATPDGVATGLRHAAERFGRPIVVYLKSEGYLTPRLVADLAADGIVAFVKYAIVRPRPEEDEFLAELVDHVDPSTVVSGIGERPAVVHLTRFGLAGFTSGSACVAPRHSTALLNAIRAGRLDDAASLRARVLPLEDLRDGIHPIRVLHDAVSGAGIAEMGPILPLLSNLSPQERERVALVARELMEADRRLQGVPAFAH